jgi:transcriptional regulator with XRE-family HTH domain
MDELKIIGMNIRHLRKQKNISQEELGDESGIDRTYIGAIERAERNITILTLKKIAITLDTTMIYLLTPHDFDDQND